MNYGNNNYYQPANPGNEILTFLKKKDVLSILIKINIAVWLIIAVIQVFIKLGGVSPDAFADRFILPFLGAPSDLKVLLFYPWTLITYMFVHIDFFHILFNMMWLYWMGKIFLEYIDKKHIIWLYILGGISGYLFFAAAFNLFPGFASVVADSRVIGASASVMAIMSAIAFYVPNYTINLLFIGRVKLIILALVLFIMDFLMISGDNAGGRIAHIGGALFGYLYITAYKKGGSSWFDISDLFRPKPKFRNVYRTERPLKDEEYNMNKAHNQSVIDSILDKISKSGYQSLSAEEKELLFKSSNKN